LGGEGGKLAIISKNSRVIETPKDLALNNALIGDGFPLFIVFIATAAFCVEGGFSNLAPYTVEQYGVNMGSRSSGLGRAANGVGKIPGSTCARCARR
jgi:hypothetical protein